MEENRDNRRLGFPNQINLGEGVTALFVFIAFTVMWPLFIFVSIIVTWNEFSFADVVVWKRKAPKINQGLDEATIKAAAGELGFDLKKKDPELVILKGIVDNVANR